MPLSLRPDEEGASLEQPLYHVLLEGRRIGPYDRRTIVGMRIKKTLTSAHVVVAGNGQQFTVGDLVKQGPLEGTFEASRSGFGQEFGRAQRARFARLRSRRLPK